MYNLTTVFIVSLIRARYVRKLGSERGWNYTFRRSGVKRTVGCQILISTALLYFLDPLN